MTSLDWAVLLALATVWGGSFFFNSIAVMELQVFTVVVFHVALAAIILLVLFRLRGERMPRDRRVWAAFFGMGLLNNAIPFSLIVWGQQHIAPGVASILSASTPLFTVVLAHLLTSDERMTGGKFAGVLIGFVGVAMMIGSDALRDLGGISSRSSCALPVQSPGHPAKRIESTAALTHEVEGVTEQDLNRFVRACRAFFKPLEGQNFSDLSTNYIDSSIKSHTLNLDDIISAYSRNLMDL